VIGSPSAAAAFCTAIQFGAGAPLPADGGSSKVLAGVASAQDISSLAERLGFLASFVQVPVAQSGGPPSHARAPMDKVACVAMSGLLPDNMVHAADLADVDGDNSRVLAPGAYVALAKGGYQDKGDGLYQDGCGASPDEGKTHPRGDPYQDKGDIFYQDGRRASPEEGKTHMRGDPHQDKRDGLFQDGRGASPEEGKTHLCGDPFVGMPGEEQMSSTASDLDQPAQAVHAGESCAYSEHGVNYGKPHASSEEHVKSFREKCMLFGGVFQSHDDYASQHPQEKVQLPMIEAVLNDNGADGFSTHVNSDSKTPRSRRKGAKNVVASCGGLAEPEKLIAADQIVYGTVQGGFTSAQPEHDDQVAQFGHQVLRMEQLRQAVFDDLSLTRYGHRLVAMSLHQRYIVQGIDLLIDLSGISDISNNMFNQLVHEYEKREFEPLDPDIMKQKIMNVSSSVN